MDVFLHIQRIVSVCGKKVKGFTELVVALMMIAVEYMPENDFFASPGDLAEVYEAMRAWTTRHTPLHESSYVYGLEPESGLPIVDDLPAYFGHLNVKRTCRMVPGEAALLGIEDGVTQRVTLSYILPCLQRTDNPTFADGVFFRVPSAELVIDTPSVPGVTERFYALEEKPWTRGVLGTVKDTPKTREHDDDIRHQQCQALGRLVAAWARVAADSPIIRQLRWA